MLLGNAHFVMSLENLNCKNHCVIYRKFLSDKNTFNVQFKEIFLELFWEEVTIAWLIHKISLISHKD